MNFQNIPPVESIDKFLDVSFRKAREKGKSKKLVGNWLQIIRTKEGLKLDIIKDSLVARLDKIIKSFPSTRDLPIFYIELMKLTLDFAKFKKSLGAISWAGKRIRFFHKNYVSQIARAKERKEVKDFSKQFYGRASSILKQIKKEMEYLEKCRKIMRNYPDVKDMFSICIYGFPNVGKTTFLNKIAGTKAKIAAYAFTTKSINTGHMKINDHDVQFFDAPGTLSRKDKMNNIELQAELAKDSADIVIYVFDLSEYCGYTLEIQEELYKKLGKDALIYVSKKDIIDKKVLDEFKHKHYSVKEIKDKIDKIWS